MFSQSSFSSRLNSAYLSDDSTTLERTQKFARSKVVVQRTVVARNIAEIAHEVGYDDFVVHILPILLEHLLSDPVAEIRALTLNSFGDLTGFLIQGDAERGYQLVVSDLLASLHHVIMKETNHDVKRTATQALVLVTPHIRASERSFVVLPIVLSLAHDPDDSSHRALAVAALAELSESLGLELCTQFVIPQICCLSEDSDVTVRTASALALSCICKVAPQDALITRLLPTFLSLVHSSQSAVRLACAESLLALTTALPLEYRSRELANIVRELLNDECPYVCRAGQRILGQFIVALQEPELIPHDLFIDFLGLASMDMTQETSSNFESIISSSSLYNLYIPRNSRGELTSLLSLYPRFLVVDDPCNSSCTSATTLHNSALLPLSPITGVMSPSRTSSPSLGWRTTGIDENNNALGSITSMWDDPRAFCAYSLAAVSYVVSGHSKELFDRATAERYGGAVPFFSDQQHNINNEHQATVIKQDCFSWDSAVEDAKIVDSNCNKNEVKQPQPELMSSIAACGPEGFEDWWTTLRPAVMTLVNCEDRDAARWIRQPIANSMPLFTSLLLKDIPVNEDICDDSKTGSRSRRNRGSKRSTDSSSLELMKLSGVLEETSFSSSTSSSSSSIGSDMQKNLAFGDTDQPRDLSFPPTLKNIDQDFLIADNINSGLCIAPCTSSNDKQPSLPEPSKISDLSFDVTATNELDWLQKEQQQRLSGIQDSDNERVTHPDTSVSVDTSHNDLFNSSRRTEEHTSAEGHTCLKSKWRRGSHRRPQVLEDLEGLCYSFLNDRASNVRIAMVDNLAGVLSNFPIVERLEYLRFLLCLLRDHRPSNDSNIFPSNILLPFASPNDSNNVKKSNFSEDDRDEQHDADLTINENIEDNTDHVSKPVTYDFSSNTSKAIAATTATVASISVAPHTLPLEAPAPSTPNPLVNHDHDIERTLFTPSSSNDPSLPTAFLDNSIKSLPSLTLKDTIATADDSIMIESTSQRAMSNSTSLLTASPIYIKNYKRKGVFDSEKDGSYAEAEPSVQLDDNIKVNDFQNTLNFEGQEEQHENAAMFASLNACTIKSELNLFDHQQQQCVTNAHDHDEVTTEVFGDNKTDVKHEKEIPNSSVYLFKETLLFDRLMIIEEPQFSKTGSHSTNATDQKSSSDSKKNAKNATSNNEPLEHNAVSEITEKEPLVSSLQLLLPTHNIISSSIHACSNNTTLREELKEPSLTTTLYHDDDDTSNSSNLHDSSSSDYQEISTLTEDNDKENYTSMNKFCSVSSTRPTNNATCSFFDTPGDSPSHPGFSLRGFSLVALGRSPRHGLGALRHMLGLNHNEKLFRGRKIEPEHLQVGVISHVPETLVGAGQQEQCWRLRHAVVKQLPRFVELVGPDHGRETVLPLFLELASDPVAVVRHSAAVVAGAVVSKLCPCLEFYFSHGGEVNCSFKDKSEIGSLRQRSPYICGPRSSIDCMNTLAKDSLSPYLHSLDTASGILSTQYLDVWKPLPKLNSNEETMATAAATTPVIVPAKQSSHNESSSMDAITAKSDYIEPNNSLNLEKLIKMEPPNFLYGPEVDVIQTILKYFAQSPNHQHRVSFIRIAESVLLNCSRGLFQLYFLRPLVRLSADPIRNVRWVWASTLRVHVRKTGRLGTNALIVSAAGSLLSSCSQLAPDPHLDLRPRKPISNIKMQRSTSASSLDSMVSARSHNKQTSANSFELTRSTHILRQPSDVGIQETLSSDTKKKKHTEEQLWRVDSPFVGNDAEIRRLLGSIVFCSESEIQWADGLDVEDLSYTDELTSLNLSRLQLSTHSPSLVSAKASCEILSPCSHPLVQNPDKESLYERTDAITELPASAACSYDTPVAPSSSPLSPGLHFLIATPKPASKTMSSEGVEGIHIDELELTNSCWEHEGLV